ncbi:MAG TPA: DUF3606 domain-containing protein [Ramlibacter sp.]|jgi:hypothetical protein|uniref:DUF3606 domain-containing protein n=1 Tax=Ramlibacter sp. TaxID=1917967 RepID=UPI002D2D776A|nr:DUF3606 domain-containing protein [Ramlibacter sp.]HZY17436.1 DUF3606 domain-containing protein [Ramlibacter sp.]
MADDATNLARQDAERIPAGDEQAVQAWARRLSTTPERLRAAIAAVGDRVHDVRVQLGHASPAGELPRPMQNAAD